MTAKIISIMHHF